MGGHMGRVGGDRDGRVMIQLVAHKYNRVIITV